MSPSRKRPRRPGQLPPGRHGLSREFIEQNQRERMLSALATVVSLAGYPEMNVEDIVVTAGVSRRTFYDHFKDKQDAFLVAYDEAVGTLLSAVRDAVERNEDFAGRVREGLGTFLSMLAAEPALAAMCIVEVVAAGPQAVERRNAAMSEFARMIEEAAGRLPDHGEQPSLIGEAIVGGVYEVVYSRILRGDARDLPQLLPDLVYSVMLPYVGREGAAREAERIRSGKVKLVDVPSGANGKADGTAIAGEPAGQSAE